MGVRTGIEWCDATWNPWTGCTKVSAGCDNCYMYRQKARWGHDASKVTRSAAKTFNLPLAKNRDGSWKIPAGSLVFVCSWSDFCHEDVPDDWRDKAMAMMRLRHDLTFLLLTKRPKRMAAYLFGFWGLASLDNIWLGVTAENQEMADERIPKLLAIDWPGKKFVSVEPMLGPVDLVRPWGQGVGDLIVDPALHTSRLDWVICGGESGPDNREIKLDWARSLRDQCVEAGVPFFLKQYSGVRPAHMPELDGKMWDQRPAP